jgi:hypothetical protein
VSAGKGRNQIDRKQFCPIFRRGVGEERMLIEAGIVDDDIERPVLRMIACTMPVSLTSRRAALAPIFSARLDAVSISISPITTWAPASAKLRTIVAPMPCAPPETKARRPSSRPKARVPAAGTD